MRKAHLKSTVVVTAILMSSLAKAEAKRIIAGPANAIVTIEEYADFLCSYCKKGEQTVSEILKNYPDKVNLAFRNMPLPAHGTLSTASAKAFNAVYLQGPALAYKFQEELFNNQDKLESNGESFLYDTALKIGADVAQMKLDMESDTVARMTEEDRKAMEAHAFKGTPSFMIGTEAVVGARSYLEIKQIIDKQLRQ